MSTTSKLDAEIRVRVPSPLKQRLVAIGKKRSKEVGSPVTASDLARQALHKFASDAEKQAA